nr:MAG TPA: hypothetical protein [Caudoviricetes sp.]
MCVSLRGHMRRRVLRTRRFYIVRKTASHNRL